MYYYAVVNLKDVVQFIESSVDQMTLSDYIEIPSEDQSLVGKWYDRYGKYGVEGAFIDPPISVLAQHSTDEINYKNQDVWLNNKLDSYATTTDLNNYALANHTHFPADIGAAEANHTHSSATVDNNGFMSHEDKLKLNGIEANANNYAHPASHPASMITGLADVATSGSYNDLNNKPTIPVIPSSLPANGGNADTVDNCHASDFASVNHNHAEEYAAIEHNHDSSYSAINHTHSNATATAAGFMSSNDKTKLNGIATGANCYVHPTSHSLNMITETDGLKIMTAAERAKLSGIAENANNYTHPATHSAAIIEETSLKKVMTAEERTKLAGIEANANNYSHPANHPASMITGLSEVAISGSYDDLSDKPTSMTPSAHTHAQSDITGLATALSGKAATTHTHTAASTTAAGFMSAADKSKLNGIASNANNYTHPESHSASMITGLADVATSGSYNDLSDKPTSMTPKAHTHAQSDITGLATALSGKSDKNHTHTVSQVSGTLPINKGGTGATTAAAALTNLGLTATAAELNKLDGVTATTAELNYVDGVTSNIQTQLNNKAASSHSHSAATTSAAGFMSSSDKTKLNGIATGANNYSHPATHAASMITGLADVATSGSYNDLSNKPTIPTTLPANGGNADTVDNYHASDFARASHTHSQYATVTALNAIWSSIYPVGSIYMSVSSTSPATLFGGTWTAFGQGRVLVGVESGGTAESTGGSKTAAISSHTHTTQGHALTIAEMPTHGHWLLNYNVNGTAGSYTNSSVQSNINKGFGGNVRTDDLGGGQSHSHGNTGASGGQSISIMQPYITCYMWKRTK